MARENPPLQTAHETPGPGLTRRDLLLLGAAAVASASPLLGARDAWAGTPPTGVPTRPFGRSGQRVSMLALGGYFDALAHPELLSLALERGVTYWEATLAKGAAGYGAYFRRNPSHRARVFLMGKTDARDAAGMQAQLDRVLAEAATSYVDFFVAGKVSGVDFLTPELRNWVETARSRGKLRYFGFSTHANMATCMRAAAELDWIDGIVTAYNYRLMRDPAMQSAVEACARAGIALTAIKSQALPTNPAAEIGADSPGARESLEGLARAGLDTGQAKLRAVWADRRFASILSMMPRAGLLEANAAAARTGDEPGAAEARLLERHAAASTRSYCAGCASRCEPRVAGALPIADVLRYRMYAQSYEDPARARAAFAALPPRVRDAIPSTDYREAERHCPQKLPIGYLMRKAASELA